MEKGKKKLYFSDYFRISDSIHAGTFSHIDREMHRARHLLEKYVDTFNKNLKIKVERAE
jgi:hypothetical protein